MRANRARRGRRPQRGEEENGTVEVEESDADSSDEEGIVVGGGHYQLGKRKRHGAAAVEAEVDESGTNLKIGDTVQAGNMTWKIIEGLAEDARRVPHFQTTFKTNLFHDGTIEADVFRALLPISKNDLLEIVRENAEESKDRQNWVEWHIDAALAIILGGGQFKEETDLWVTQRVGLMPPPDFGRFLSRDRFMRILRYWARVRQEERDKLRDRSVGFRV